MMSRAQVFLVQVHDLELRQEEPGARSRRASTSRSSTARSRPNGVLLTGAAVLRRPGEGFTLRIVDVRTHVLLDPGFDPGATSSAQDTIVVEIETDGASSGSARPT